MAKNVFLRIALPLPLRQYFDYLAPQDIDTKKLIPGIRIRVPFQARTLVGFLISVESECSIPLKKLKTALEILDEQPLFTADVFKLCTWAADYYHYALGEVLASALPSFLRQGRSLPARMTKDSHAVQFVEPLLLNSDQAAAVKKIGENKNQFKTYLLAGVTGSGKTEVYLHIIYEFLKLNKQVLVLVPEISLTPQTIARFQARFNIPIVALHSNLTEKQRLQAWCAVHSGVATIVIGTRSAIFAPFSQLGLIIVDEEHDQSFKQQERFRYHARDLAIMRASLNNIPIVLGSATPSLESVLNAKRDRYDYLSLPARAGSATLPQYQLLDIKRCRLQEGLSPSLLEAMQVHLQQENQVLLFLNRRGFAPILYCTQCAFILKCKRCEVRMVYHRSPQRMQCHQCDSHCNVPTHCAQCNEASLQPIGLGTQRLEKIFSDYFPGVPIIRIDRDTVKRKDSLQALLQQINDEKKAILIGTQMLAKGHHFPRVTLVGVIDADSGLLSTDFRATEQMGQLLLQVAGRAGRADKPGTVLIQTTNPQNPLLQTLIAQGYEQFAETILHERAETLWPPYSYLALFKAEAYTEQIVAQFLSGIKNLFPQAMEHLTFLGPAPALIAKRKGLHCQHLVVKASSRMHLQQCLKQIIEKMENLTAAKTVKWTLDVDPVEV